MTLILRTKTNINNPSAPYLNKYDPIESRAGSIFLWDAGRNPTTAFNTSAEASSKTLGNLLAEYGDSVVGGVSDFERAYVFNNANSIKSEITAKGGLHCIATQTLDTNQNYIGVRINDALKAYLDAQVALGNIYFSVWRRTTRKTNLNSGTNLSLINYQTAFLAHTNTQGIEITVGGDKTLSPLLYQSNDDSIGVPQFVGVRPSGRSGSSANKMMIGAGCLPPWGISQALNRSPSVIYYRVYIENLALSGRSYAEVSALDQAEFTKAFGVGGRFHGDTWSNPATLLP